MSIETFADKVDELLKAGDGITRDKPDVLTFLNSNWIEQHILSAVANGISKLGVEVESVRDAMAVENPAFLYRGRNADGVWRRLILRSAGNSLPYHSTFREPFAIVAISNLVVDEYGIIGTKGEDWYYRPSRDLRLEKKATHHLEKGDVIVRTDVNTLLDVRDANNVKYVLQIQGEADALGEEAGYQLAFSRDDLTFIATSMMDLNSTKMITVLEILENFGSTQTGDIAFKLTDHYSPIVRWRALSSLNKSADPRTEDVLVAFCADPVSFIQEGARQALGKAGRKA